MKDALGVTIHPDDFLFVSRPANGKGNTSVHKVVKVTHSYVISRRLATDVMCWNNKNCRYEDGFGMNDKNVRINKTKRTLVFDPPAFIREKFENSSDVRKL